MPLEFDNGVGGDDIEDVEAVGECEDSRLVLSSREWRRESRVAGNAMASSLNDSNAVEDPDEFLFMAAEVVVVADLLIYKSSESGEGGELDGRWSWRGRLLK